MATKDIENRVFVGGLSWDVTERQLEDAFRRFDESGVAGFGVEDTNLLAGTSAWRIVEIMVERGTGRPRGFGFLTFGDRRGMEDAIREMHGRELGDRIISVNRAEPKPGEDPVGSYGGGGGGGGSYSSAPRTGYRGGSDRAPESRQDECFKCGRLGHWARDCPSAGGGRGGRDPPLPSRPRYGDIGSRGDRFSDRDRYLDDRYDAAASYAAADRDRFDSRDKAYGGGRDRFLADRFPPVDRYGGGDRFRASDRYPQTGYEKDRGYDRDPAPRRGVDRYGGGGGGAVRAGGRFSDRPGPYDRPARGGRQSSFDRY